MVQRTVQFCVSLPGVKEEEKASEELGFSRGELLYTVVTPLLGAPKAKLTAIMKTSVAEHKTASEAVKSVLGKAYLTTDKQLVESVLGVIPDPNATLSQSVEQLNTTVPDYQRGTVSAAAVDALKTTGKAAVPTELTNLLSWALEPSELTKLVVPKPEDFLPAANLKSVTTTGISNPDPAIMNQYGELFAKINSIINPASMSTGIASLAATTPGIVIQPATKEAMMGSLETLRANFMKKIKSKLIRKKSNDIKKAIKEVPKELGDVEFMGKYMAACDLLTRLLQRKKQLAARKKAFGLGKEDLKDDKKAEAIVRSKFLAPPLMALKDTVLYMKPLMDIVAKSAMHNEYRKAITDWGKKQGVEQRLNGEKYGQCVKYLYNSTLIQAIRTNMSVLGDAEIPADKQKMVASIEAFLDVKLDEPRTDAEVIKLLGQNIVTVTKQILNSTNGSVVKTLQDLFSDPTKARSIIGDLRDFFLKMAPVVTKHKWLEMPVQLARLICSSVYDPAEAVRLLKTSKKPSNSRVSASVDSADPSDADVSSHAADDA